MASCFDLGSQTACFSRGCEGVATRAQVITTSGLASGKPADQYHALANASTVDTIGSIDGHSGSWSDKGCRAPNYQLGKNGELGPHTWKNTDGAYYEVCYDTSAKAGETISRKNTYQCDYGTAEPLCYNSCRAKPAGQLGPNGVKTDYTWKNTDGAYYETCYDAGQGSNFISGNKVPRKNTYYCDYQGRSPHCPPSGRTALVGGFCRNCPVRTEATGCAEANGQGLWGSTYPLCVQKCKRDSACNFVRWVSPLYTKSFSVHAQYGGVNGATTQESVGFCEGLATCTPAHDPNWLSMSKSQMSAVPFVSYVAFNNAKSPYCSDYEKTGTVVHKTAMSLTACQELCTGQDTCNAIAWKSSQCSVYAGCVPGACPAASVSSGKCWGATYYAKVRARGTC